MGLDSGGSGPGRLQPLDHGLGVAQPLQKLRRGARLGNGELFGFRAGAETEDAEVAPFVDVGDGGHGGLEDDLGMILEEVDLQSAVGEMKHDRRSSAEPRAQKWKTNLGLRGGNNVKAT